MIDLLVSKLTHLKTMPQILWDCPKVEQVWRELLMGSQPKTWETIKKLSIIGLGSPFLEMLVWENERIFQLRQMMDGRIVMEVHILKGEVLHPLPPPKKQCMR